MDVLVDSCVWSLALRRTTPDAKVADAIRSLVKDSLVKIIGPIRQEVLSGINNHDHYLNLRSVLGNFPDIELRTHDFEYAAELSNLCRAKGVQGSHTDFLMCAVAKTHKLAIYTADQDFENYSKIIHLTLFHPRI